ncbi:MAG: molybdate ABC transporter substrate-binding protein [Proteobacteria bacterium]|nr:molybdate ABC transporter substrate-binding protein [Pseudomonadota bacterium]
MRTTWRIVASLLLALTALATHAAERDRPAITVFAAVSLTNALQEAGAAFTHATSVPVKFSFAASSTLARQIESGARIDVFVSADQEWMDYLQARGLIDRASRRDLLGNRLVLVAPADSTLQLKIAPRFALLAALGAGRLATGDPDSVPVGKYARSALISLGVWNEVQDRLIRAENVRSALAFVARGEAPLGIVYETDALTDKKVRQVDVFPADTHLPILYPAALTRTAGADGVRFLQFLRGRAAGNVWRKYGFTVLD